jgi:hypothetical protein
MRITIPDTREPRASFFSDRHATRWYWYPWNVGGSWLRCYDGMLRLECEGFLPRIGRFGGGPVYVHTNPRIVLSTPTMPFRDYFTVLTFEEGMVSCSFIKQEAQLRTALAACGFEVIDAPTRAMWPHNHRKLWRTHGVQPAAAGPNA